MHAKQIIVGSILIISLAVGEHVRADDTTDAINQLKQQIQELDQKVRILERQQELETETSQDKAKQIPQIVIGNNGLSVGSADSNFVFQLHGVLQVDSRTFFNDNDNH